MNNLEGKTIEELKFKLLTIELKILNLSKKINNILLEQCVNKGGDTTVDSILNEHRQKYEFLNEKQNIILKEIENEENIILHFNP